MKIAFINGSPKAKNTVSGVILSYLKGLMLVDVQVEEYKLRSAFADIKDIEKIGESDAIVLAFPLYVDGIPSHFLHCLVQMEAYFKENPRNIKVYSVVNCGFYEGTQATLALEMVENWCDRCGLSWGQGVGVGGGGMLAGLTPNPDGKGVVKSLWDALKVLANNITTNSSSKNIYTIPGFPRILYQMGGNMGWNQQIRSNGLTKKDLSIRK